MAWKQIEATPLHLTFIVLSGFLLLYALFSVFIRNRLHLSEPPLALLTGIAFGPKGFNTFAPELRDVHDNVLQEFTRIIAGVQVFVIGLELPKGYLRKHWRSLLYLLGPVMAFGWVVCAVFLVWLLNLDWPTALLIAACLTPTDPVLAASVLSNSKFSSRVPNRIKSLLSCESGCNDGVSFPFLYVGVSLLTRSSALGAVKKWVLITMLWQCLLGTIVGLVLGLLAESLLKFSDRQRLVGPTSFIIFYMLLAFFSIGIASTLGLDDFLVAFFAGVGFSRDGWFVLRTRQSNLNNILDLMLNSTFFVFLGAIMPWDQFTTLPHTPGLTPWKLFGFLMFVLVFRRIPAVLALKSLIPDIRTWWEALFCGHFGPMGVGAIFLAIEARAQLETDTSIPLPVPDQSSPNIRSIELVTPVVMFVVMGSTLVHGFSVAALSFANYIERRRNGNKSDPNNPEPLAGMEHEESEDESEESEEGDGWEERRTRIALSN